MKNKLTAAIFFCCGSLMAQRQPLPSFAKLEVNTPIQLEIIQSDSEQLDAGENSKIRYEVHHGTMEFTTGDFRMANLPVKLYVKNLEKIEINGVAKVNSQVGNTLTGEKLDIEANGATQLLLNLHVKQLKVEGNGATKLTFIGQAEKLEAELNGAVKLDAAQLIVNDANVEANGASKFSVYAKNELKVSANGFSIGYFYGDPIKKSIDVDGYAKISPGAGQEVFIERNSTSSDTTKLRLGNRRVIIIDESKELHMGDNRTSEMHHPSRDLKHVYAGFEMGLNTFTTSTMNSTMPSAYNVLQGTMSKSKSYGFNLFEGDALLIPNKLALTSGFGIEFQDIELNSHAVLTPASKYVTSTSVVNPLMRNRLYNFNFNVPLLIKFAPRTVDKRNGFHLAVGLIGTYRAHVHNRIDNVTNGYKEVVKVKDDFNVNPFYVAATVRVGYGWFRGFVNYGLTSYFKRSAHDAFTEEPDIRVLTAGITVIPFN